MRALLSLSELILEDVVAVPDPEGRFELHVRFESAIEPALPSTRSRLRSRVGDDRPRARFLT